MVLEKNGSDFSIEDFFMYNILGLGGKINSKIHIKKL